MPDYNADLAAKNAKLDAILATVNALAPDSGQAVLDSVLSGSIKTIDSAEPNIKPYTFRRAAGLQKAIFRTALVLPQYICCECTALKVVDSGAATDIVDKSFRGCTLLDTFILRTATLARLENINALDGTAIATGTGYIYVPRALVSQYQAATNWVTYKARFRAIEDYPGITGG